jgi:hypothetical protein
VNITLRADKGNTHHDTARQCLLVINSLWVVLSLAGQDGVNRQDESELSEALSVYGNLGILFTNMLYAQVAEMELERRERERKGASDE